MIVFTLVLFPGWWTLGVVAGVLSIVPAWLSFTYLEEPVRHSGVKGRQVVALAAVCMLLPIAASVTLMRHADAAVASAQASIADQKPRQVGVPDPNPPVTDLFTAALLAERGQWQVFGEPCLSGASDVPPGKCVFFTGVGKPRAVLVGDSHAGSYSSGFLDATKQLGYQAEVITTGGCPFTDVAIGRDAAVDRHCVKRNQQIAKYLEQNPPQVLAIANRSPRFVSPVVKMADEVGGNQPCIVDAAKGGCLNHGAAVKAWSDSLRRTADRLQPLGTKLLVLQTVPEQRNGLEKCVIGTTVRLGCLQTPRSLSWDRRKDVIGAEARDAQQLGFSVYDPFDFFCDQDTCRQFIGGRFLYRNDDHLNPWGSEALAGAIEQKLKAMQ